MVDDIRWSDIGAYGGEANTPNINQLADEGLQFLRSIQAPPYKGSRVRVFGHNDQMITELPEDFYATDAFTDHAINSMEKLKS